MNKLLIGLNPYLYGSKCVSKQMENQMGMDLRGLNPYLYGSKCVRI